MYNSKTWFEVEGKNVIINRGGTGLNPNPNPHDLVGFFGRVFGWVFYAISVFFGHSGANFGQFWAIFRRKSIIKYFKMLFKHVLNPIYPPPPPKTAAPSVIGGSVNPCALAGGLATSYSIHVCSVHRATTRYFYLYYMLKTRI